MKVHVFGNEYLKEDSMAKRVADMQLDDIEFVKCTRPEELFDAGKDLTILDVVEGIRKTMLIEDPNKLRTSTITSLHDFDLAYFLKLMKETDQIKDVRIIGVPDKGDINIIRDDVTSLLKVAPGFLRK